MRLIDADELRKQMKELCEKRAEEANMTGDRAVGVTWNDAVILVKNAPTIDAEPVENGRWETDGIQMDDGEYLMTRCTVCGTPYEYGHNDNYCGYCGAKMDEVKNEID